MQQRRARRSESTWREIIARHAESGQAVEVFCREQGLSRSVFTRWRSRLAGASSPEAKAAAVLKPARFLDVGELASEASRTIRLELGDGIVLTISR